MKFNIVVRILICMMIFACKSQKENTEKVVEKTTIKEIEKMEPKFNIDLIRGGFDITFIQDVELNEVKPTINFDGEGLVNGYNGCNSYFGDLKPDEEIVIKQIGTTRMACEGEKSDVEKHLMEKLKSITNIDYLQGEEEVNLYRDNEVVIKAKKIILEGSFLLVSLSGKKNDNTQISFNISEGILNGNTGCNSIGGKVIQNGYDIDLSGIFATEKACEGFDMKKEAEFLKLLSSSNKYKFEDGMYHFYQGINKILTFKKI